MKIFISWSGDLSKNLAEIFRQWIPSVIQAAKPYYTPDDITKGTRWATEIAKELEASKICIICLTKDNLQSPWIMFETGSIAKNIDKSKICPILFNVEPSDIEGPLVQFQAAKFSKTEIKKVLKMINNELGENALTPDVLDSVFDMWWPKLDEQIKIELSKPLPKDKRKEGQRSDRDMLEEVLSLTREYSLNRMRRDDRDVNIHPKAIYELIRGLEKLLERINIQENRELALEFTNLFRPLDYIINEADLNMPRSMREDLRESLLRLHSIAESYYSNSKEPEETIVKRRPVLIKQRKNIK
jgi:hypothetical protein